VDALDHRPVPDVAPIRAAGGVVWRREPARDVEVVLVHRARFDDWSLPKGKLKRREHPIVGAVREVREETGLQAGVGPRLPTVTYEVWSSGGLVEKMVDYWAMAMAADLGFTPGSEVDGLAWLPLGEAAARVSYPHDAKVLAAFSELPPLHRPVVLVRHASAGGRHSWPGADADRPLDQAGLARATQLVGPLACFAPGRIVTAPARRCAQTVEPLAASLGLPLETDPAFDESADPQAAATLLLSMAGGAAPVVVCSQGGLIPGTLAALTGKDTTQYPTAKGDGWVLSFADTGLAQLDELP
jgi:8-oxo-dGTP pyrophosphatase MutT (NUDIX family)/phosphohistidine phosphatase SixA